jgi:hypothetical protein
MDRDWPPAYAQHFVAAMRALGVAAAILWLLVVALLAFGLRSS